MQDEIHPNKSNRGKKKTHTQTKTEKLQKPKLQNNLLEPQGNGNQTKIQSFTQKTIK